MIDRTSRELLAAFAPRLQTEFQVEPFLPLEIKQRLERLRLQEMQRETRTSDET